MEKERLKALYDRVAGRYDGAVLLYYALGYRYHAYRRRAIDTLHLRPGDTAVDLGCGTGVNLAALREAVGAEGRVIGVGPRGRDADRRRVGGSSGVVGRTSGWFRATPPPLPIPCAQTACWRRSQSV